MKNKNNYSLKNDCFFIQESYTFANVCPCYIIVVLGGDMMKKILIEKSFGCARYIYNYFLDKTNGRKYIKIFDYIKDLPLLSIENEWLKEVDSCLLRCSIFNL